MARKKSYGKALLLAASAVGAAAWAIAPRSFADKRDNFVPALPETWYAHRGLHDAGSGLTAQYAAESGEYVAFARRMAMKAGYGTPECVSPIAPENSLAAFAAACEAGYGIELDIQLTMDGQVVVIHDADLMRVAGDPRRVCDLTYDELTRIPLFPMPSSPGCAIADPVPNAIKAPALVTTPAKPPLGYYQHVPLFSDVLKVVAGRVPLIVEYKFDAVQWTPRCNELMEKGDALLQAYDGDYVVESFHPLAMHWYREHRPEVCRGQLAEPMTLREYGVPGCLASAMAFNWLSRPDFVAYDWHGGSKPQVRLTRAMGATPVSWTVRNRDEVAECGEWFDVHVFESFIPDKA